MRRRALLGMIVGTLLAASGAYADVLDLMLNSNGTTYCLAGMVNDSPGLCANTPANLNAIPGVASSLDTAIGGTGLGTVTLTYSAPGTYKTSLWIWEELIPQTAFNEYGTTGGTLDPSESYQIDVADHSYALGVDPNFGGLAAGAGTIVANTAANTLANKNFVPGSTDNSNLFAPCTGLPTCNDYTSLALGTTFTLGANEQETLSFTVSTTAPTSGFYLKQIDPGTGTGSPEVDYFYSLTATTQQVGGPTVPEANSWFGLGMLASLIALGFRRSFLAKQS